MKNKTIILIPIILIVLIITITLITRDKNTILECSISEVMIDSESDQKYTFYGINDRVEKEELNVKIYSDNKDILEEYKNILSEDKQCENISLHDTYLSYNCEYDLINEHYYNNIENDDGELSFKALKEEFENNDFVCNYK